MVRISNAEALAAKHAMLMHCVDAYHCRNYNEIQNEPSYKKIVALMRMLIEA
jgi:hypothetical protein